MRIGWYLLAPLALPVMLGAQVATVRGPAPAPGGPYFLHAVVPTPAAVTGPVYVGNHPTESAVIGRTLTHNYHEVYALVAGGGVGPFPVGTTGRRPTRSFLNASAVAALTKPDVAILEITDTAGTVRFPLTGPPGPGSQFITNNDLALIRYEHISLGRFGNAHVWLMLRAGLKQIDVVLNWHTGVVNTQDVLFTNAKIIVPQGIRWIPNLADSASQNGSLVNPTGTNLPHIIPQRHDRSFRFSVLPTSVPYRAPWSWNGMAVWSAGGVPAAGFATPATITGANLDAEAASWRSGLQSLGLVEGGDHPPVSPMWPAMGVHYGGATSGRDMAPFDGVRWLVTGQVSGFERFATEQLRMRSRMRGCIVEADGGAVRPWEHLTNGQADWRMYNSIFERSGGILQDGPFEWPATRLLSQAAYNPELFDPTDCQHLVREWNQNAALAMTTADPLAMHSLKMEAAKTLMTYWHGAGQANRFGPMPAPGRGVVMDRGWAWAAMVIAQNYVWSSDAERAQYDPWIQKLIDYLQVAQMQSGHFGIYPGSKEAKNPPYGDNPNGEGNPLYLIGSGLGECYFAATLAHLERVSPYAAARTPDMLRRQAAGFKDLSWATNDNGTFASGAWYTYAVAPAGSITRYVTRAEWPASLVQGMATYSPQYTYSDGYHVGYTLAALKRAGAPQADELLNRFTGRPTVAQSLATMIGWGTGGSGTPVEQFWPAIGQWSQP